MKTEIQDVIQENPETDIATKKPATNRHGLFPRRSETGEETVPFKAFKTIREMRKEAKTLSRMLKAPKEHYGEDQSKDYISIEKRITRLGMSLGLEAEKRAGFSMDVFKADLADCGNDLGKALRASYHANEELRTAEARYVLLKYRGGSTPTDVQRIEISKALQAVKDAEELGHQLHLELEKVQEKERQRIATIRRRAGEKLSAAYASVIADIRPVGGFVPGHDLSEAGSLEVLRSSVGQHYPSDWLKASEEAGPLVVAETIYAGRAKYSAHQFYPANPSKETQIQESFAGLVTAESAVEFMDKLSAEGIKIHSHGTSFDNGDEHYRIVEFAKRDEFDPDIDLADENGVPLGTGWKFGHVPRTFPGGLHMPEEKVWYREPVNYGRTVPTVFLAPESFDLVRRQSSAYHEFAHRVEDVVRGGVIEHLEEAFLVRRTTDENGVREELSQMTMGDGTLGGTELGRKGTFMMHYIGKEYLNHRSREVLSIGSEAVFAGNYGSFLGIDGLHKPDLDHRGFVLGIFAVV